MKLGRGDQTMKTAKHQAKEFSLYQKQREPWRSSQLESTQTDLCLGRALGSPQREEQRDDGGRPMERSIHQSPIRGLVLGSSRAGRSGE